jgi:hypothetical protein
VASANVTPQLFEFRGASIEFGLVWPVTTAPAPRVTAPEEIAEPFTVAEFRTVIGGTLVMSPTLLDTPKSEGIVPALVTEAYPPVGSST